MQVRVLYFASLRELLGRGEEQLELDSGSTVADLLSTLRTRQDWPTNFANDDLLRAAVDQEFATQSAVLADGCEVALFPPVTGG